MTPTPEEVKDRIAKRIFNSTWKEVMLRRVSTDQDYCINEAMQEYHKEMVEKSSNELPTRKDFIKWMDDTTYSYEDSPHDVFEWMKEQASVVIVKLTREKRDIEINLKHCTVAIEQKDKEIEELKEEIKYYRKTSAF